MSALTLVEAAKVAAENGETKKAGIIATYAEKSDILNAIPFEGIMGNALTFTQEGTLPTTAFRAVNEGYVASNGTFAPQTESLYIAGGDLDVDKFIIATQGAEVRSRHEALKIKALAIGMTDQMLKGDSASDARGFDGLQKRITGAQLIANGNTANGDPLSMTKLDLAIDQVDSPTHIIMSRAMRLKFTTAYRSSSFPNIIMQADDTGKQYASYNGIPILVGYPQNLNTKILPFTEASPGGGTATSASIYVVNFSEDGVMGIQNSAIYVRDLGELNTLPVWRTRIEWYMSMVIQSPFAAARLSGISNAAIVA